MNQNNLPAIFSGEFAKPVVEIITNADIRDLFGIPASVLFQGCNNTAEYQLRIDEFFREFTSWLDAELESDQSSQQKLSRLEQMRFAVDEYLRSFNWNLEKQSGLNLLYNTRVDIKAWDTEYTIYIQAVVSGFLEIQHRTLERTVRYLDLRMRLLRAEKDEGKDDIQMTLVSTLAGLVQNMQTSPNVPEPGKTKIVWNGSAQEFVAHFAPLIQSRQLFLEAKHKLDTDPIVKILHQTFFIRKAKGDGEVSAGTLRTYFKEFNAGKH